MESNIRLHPTVCDPDKLQALMDFTGLIPVPSGCTRGIMLVSPEEAYGDLMDEVSIHG